MTATVESPSTVTLCGDTRHLHKSMWEKDYTAHSHPDGTLHAHCTSDPATCSVTIAHTCYPYKGGPHAKLGKVYWAIGSRAEGSEWVAVFGTRWGVRVEHDPDDVRAHGYTGAVVWKTRAEAERHFAALAPGSIGAERGAVHAVVWQGDTCFRAATAEQIAASGADA